MVVGSAVLATARKARAASLASDLAENSLTVPDLQDGFLIFNYDGVIDHKVSTNRWCESVECVLERKSAGSDGRQRAYLSQECRAEMVGHDPFGHRGNYEWVGISAWNGNYHLRSGPGNQPEKFCEKMPPDLTIKVTCPDRKARRLSFEETLQLLQSDFRGGFKQLYLAVTYHLGGYEYHLTAASRYINFPHPQKSVQPYLQPIQGYVLYEQDGRFYTAYVVAWIEQGQTKSLQFKVRDQVTYGKTVTHDFNRTVRINDDRSRVDFFVYE